MVEAAGAHRVGSHGGASEAVRRPELGRQQKTMTSVEEGMPLSEDGRGPAGSIRVDGDVS